MGYKALNGRKIMNHKGYEVIMYYFEELSKKKIMTELMRHFGNFCIK
jgi:hypothetical protein